MHRSLPFFLLLALVLSAPLAVAAESVPAHIHFVVIPETLPDGSSAQDSLPQFEKAVIGLAGGFTELGTTRGGDIVNGAVERQNNISFLIGADKDIGNELRALVKKCFGGADAFILSWPGTMTN